MSMSTVARDQRAYDRAATGSPDIRIVDRISLWVHARRDARQGIPESTGRLDWAAVPTYVVETSNALRLARASILGLLIANRAELREYDALVARRSVEQALVEPGSMRDSESRDEDVERLRRATRNLTSVERQIPEVEAHLRQSVHEAASWAALFFDIADHRLAWYWRVLRRVHPDRAFLGATPPTVLRPDWITESSLDTLLALYRGDDIATEGD